MAKRRRSYNIVAKRRRSYNIMAKRRWSYNIMAKRRRSYNIMAKRKGTKRQTMIYKSVHKKIKIAQHEPYQKNRGVQKD